MKTALGKLASGLVALVLSGCASLPPDFERPVVHVADIRLVGATLFEQHFKLALRIQNPNPVALPISGLNYDLAVNGVPFARGTSAEAVTVPPYGTALLQADSYTTLAGLLKQLVQLGAGGAPKALRYRLTGRLSVAGLGTPLPFEHEAEIGLPVLEALIEPGETASRQGAF